MINLRKLAHRVFGIERPVDLPARAHAYRLALTSPDGKKHILPDLIDFTGVLRPAPLHGDAFAQGRVQGRRDVGLHVLENLSLKPIELYAIWVGQPIIKPEDFQHG